MGAVIGPVARASLVSYAPEYRGLGVTEGAPFGEYRLLRRLGAGGMAEVFLAERTGPGGFSKRLVIKKILPHLAANRTFVDMFLREARFAALVDHPNLVHVSAFGEIDGEFYLSMEFVDGFTLTEVLRRVGQLAPGVATRITVDVLEALHAVHEARDGDGEPLGLVHRDIGPKNVMLTRAGAVKVLDFGIAVAAGEAGTPMGTRRFMAPEQLSAGSVDRRADLYAAGVLLFVLLTGEAPVRKTPTAPVDRHASIPDAVWPGLSAALALDPDDRAPSARQMQEPLEIFLASRGREGTRAHLGELLATVLPSAPAIPAGGVFERWTRPLTRLTGTPIQSVPEGPKPRAGVGRRALVTLGAGLAFGGAATWFIVSSEDQNRTSGGRSLTSQQSRASSTPKTPVPRAEEDPGETVQRVSPTPEDAGPTTTRSGERAPSEQTPRPGRETRRRTKRRANKPGYLTIDTTPWTVVYLGSRRLGLTPLVEVALPSGRHQLRLVNPDLSIERRITVRIRPGRTTRERRTL